MNIFILLFFLLFTPFRATIFFLIPILIPFIYHTFKLKTHYSFFWIFFVSIISFLLNNYSVTPIANNIVSILIISPLLLLWYSELRYNNYKITDLFFKNSRLILRIIDILGIICFIFKNQGDDTFRIVYGTHFEEMHGLALINLYYFLYLATYIKSNRIPINIKTILRSPIVIDCMIFGLSFILCFYGLSFACILLTIITYVFFFRFSIKRIILLIIITGCIGGTYFMLFQKNAQYINNNITKVFFNQNDARKVLMFGEAIELINREADNFLFGIGPGGYNSRVCFMLNPDSKNILTQSIGIQQPTYHMKYIFPLWNMDFVSFENFTDGTRNKPFSSLVSFIMEYGIIFFILFLLSFKMHFNRLNKYKERIEGQLLHLLYILTFYLLFLDRWFESSEFLFIILFLMFVEKKMKEKYQY